MKYSVEKAEKYTILKLEEEKLDSTIAPELKSELINIHTAGALNIILDFSSVKYVDSSGLSAILVANRLCESTDGSLVLCHLNEHVNKLITISQLTSVLNILPTKQEAIDSVFLNELEKDLKGDEDDEN